MARPLHSRAGKIGHSSTQTGHSSLMLLWANALLALAVCALLAGAAVWLGRQPYFAIKHIQIQPAQAQHFDYVSPALVRATLAGSPDGVEMGNFFSADLARLRALFETVPWVRQAQVRRLWPDTLRVQLEEHQPLAVWNEDQMLNTWGEAFNANQGELADGVELVHLFGPPQSEARVVQRYAELLRWLEPLQLTVQQLRLNPRHAWSAQLASPALTQGLHLELGRDPLEDGEQAGKDPSQKGTDPAQEGIDPAQGFAASDRAAPMAFSRRIQRFVQAWPQVQARLNHVAKRQVLRADLRYPHGFAVTLSTPTRPSSTRTR